MRDSTRYAFRGSRRQTIGSERALAAPTCFTPCVSPLTLHFYANFSAFSSSHVFAEETKGKSDCLSLLFAIISHIQVAGSEKKGILERMAESVVIGDGGYVFELEKRGYVKAGPWTPEATVEFPEAGEKSDLAIKKSTISHLIKIAILISAEAACR